jgi:hypothetical protein
MRLKIEINSREHLVSMGVARHSGGLRKRGDHRGAHFLPQRLKAQDNRRVCCYPPLYRYRLFREGVGLVDAIAGSLHRSADFVGSVASADVSERSCKSSRDDW